MACSGRRRPDTRKIKSHRTYRPDEAARVTGINKQTVHRWIKAGLPAIKDQKPYLIMGADLLDYLKNRYGPKVKCADEHRKK